MSAAADAFAGVLGTGRGTMPRPGVLDGPREHGLAELGRLRARWQAGEHEPLLGARRAHHEDPGVHPDVRDALHATLAELLAALGHSAAPSLLSDVLDLFGLPAEHTDAQLHAYDRALRDHAARAPMNLHAATVTAFAATCAAHGVCGLLAARSAQGPWAMLQGLLSAGQLAMWKAISIDSFEAAAWLGAVPVEDWRHVWERALIAGNVHACPYPITEQAGPLRLRADALHAELTALASRPRGS